MRAFPFAEKDPVQWVLVNTDSKDVRFTGWLLGVATNQVKGVSRWKERALYQTVGGTLVAHRLGRTVNPGEVDRGQILTAPTTPEGEKQIADFLGQDAVGKRLLGQVGIDHFEDLP